MVEPIHSAPPLAAPAVRGPALDEISRVRQVRLTRQPVSCASLPMLRVTPAVPFLDPPFALQVALQQLTAGQPLLAGRWEVQISLLEAADFALEDRLAGALAQRLAWQVPPERTLDALSWASFPVRRGPGIESLRQRMLDRLLLRPFYDLRDRLDAVEPDLRGSLIEALRERLGERLDEERAVGGAGVAGAVAAGAVRAAAPAAGAVQFLVTRCDRARLAPKQLPGLLSWAAGRGHLGVLGALNQRLDPATLVSYLAHEGAAACRAAAAHGQAATLTWLLAQAPPKLRRRLRLADDAATLQMAADRGDANVVHSLLRGAPVADVEASFARQDYGAYRRAIERGHVPTLCALHLWLSRATLAELPTAPLWPATGRSDVCETPVNLAIRWARWPVLDLFRAISPDFALDVWQGSKDLLRALFLGPPEAPNYLLTRCQPAVLLGALTGEDLRYLVFRSQSGLQTLAAQLGWPTLAAELDRRRAWPGLAEAALAGRNLNGLRLLLAQRPGLLETRTLLCRGLGIAVTPADLDWFMARMAQLGYSRGIEGAYLDGIAAHGSACLMEYQRAWPTVPRTPTALASRDARQLQVAFRAANLAVVAQLWHATAAARPMFHQRLQAAGNALRLLWLEHAADSHTPVANFLLSTLPLDLRVQLCAHLPGPGAVNFDPAWLAWLATWAPPSNLRAYATVINLAASLRASSVAAVRALWAVADEDTQAAFLLLGPGLLAPTEMARQLPTRSLFELGLEFAAAEQGDKRPWASSLHRLWGVVLSDVDLPGARRDLQRLQALRLAPCWGRWISSDLLHRLRSEAVRDWLYEQLSTAERVSLLGRCLLNWQQLKPAVLIFAHRRLAEMNITLPPIVESSLGARVWELGKVHLPAYRVRPGSGPRAEDGSGCACGQTGLAETPACGPPLSLV